MSGRTAYSTAPHPPSHPTHHNTVIPEHVFSLQGCCVLPGHFRAKAPLSPTPKPHHFTKYLNYLPPIFTEQIFLFTSLLSRSGNRRGSLTKVQDASLPWTTRWIRGKGLHNPPWQSLAPPSTVRHCSLPYSAGSRGQWGPLAHTNLLPDWRLLSLEGHKLMWEAVSRSHPQHFPSYPSTTNITSFTPGLGQGYFYWEPWGSGSAASLGADSSKHSSHQWHSGHGHNSWSDFHTCFCPEKKGPSAPFFQAPRPQQKGKLTRAGKSWHGACTNMVKVKEE